MTKSMFKVFALLFGGLALVGCLFGIYRVWARPATIGWTPKHLALPATSFSDRVEVYVGGLPLTTALAGKRLSFAANETIVPAPLADSDVTVSFNNTYQERAARIPLLIGLAAGAGAAAMLFLFGLMAPNAMMRLDAGNFTELHLRQV